MNPELTQQVLDIITVALNSEPNTIMELVTPNRNGATVRFTYESESDLELLNNTLLYCEAADIFFDVIKKPEEKSQAWYLDRFYTKD
tara:strand:- start:450 stop:710 length:261 start_codon:yes stop_codon:yes gene_type:complete